jgi:hypothetical protein
MTNETGFARLFLCRKPVNSGLERM